MGGSSHIARDPRSPRYVTSSHHNDDLRAEYFDSGMDDSYDTMYSPRLHERSGYGRGIDRRTNLDVANANGSIVRASMHAQLHPMMTSDSGYPVDFAVPKRLEDFLRMSDSQLERIMLAYELDPLDSPYYRGRGMPRESLLSDLGTSRFLPERQRNLGALFEFLGAYNLAEQLMHTRRERLGSRQLNNNRLLSGR
ncbi:hypothetical protein LTR37_006825 [Vermiconidia calcicola]|uniref:Uncharacterized protein n=1 Tax=Vermiconidia calcicola TaxID=1690605 RepID=A0ACC3NF36_9PEZI|nr:hypothetical protein LTR37_006825 [Vermiconidia calcicola]